MWHTSHRVRMLVLISLLMICGAVVMLALSIGSSGVWAWWLPRDNTEMEAVMLSLRLPRVVAGLGVGALLAMAGALQQVLLRNPQADPYILGTASAAGVGALLAILLSMATFWIPLAAGAGALLSIFVVFSLAGSDRSAAQTKVLLTGIALSSFCVAINALLLSLAPDDRLRGMIFWLLGDLSGAEGNMSAIAAILLLVLVWPFARDLNRLSSGLMQAHALGLPIQPMRYALYVVVAVATAIAVITAGAIGFVGLIVPHALRLIIGHDHRYLLPASAMGGGALLVLADLIGRTVMAPQQIPVGVITSLIGVPVFLWLLRQRWQS